MSRQIHPPPNHSQKFHIRTAQTPLLVPTARRSSKKPGSWGHATKLHKESRIDMPVTIPAILRWHRCPDRTGSSNVKVERRRHHTHRRLTAAPHIHSGVVLLLLRLVLWIMRLISKLGLLRLLRLLRLGWSTRRHTRHASNVQRCRRQWSR